MKIEIDTDSHQIVIDGDRKIPLYSDEGFAVARDLWLKVGWNQKYTYTFTWFGVPIIQLPDDMIRYQEAVFELEPDVIIETGVAHGGSLIYSASLLRLIGKGKVIGVDIEIRPHNRARIESHPLAGMITLLEDSSVAPDLVARVKNMIGPNDKVLVVLDSNHSYDHVAKELVAYSPLVSIGSYIVATDGMMRDLADVPRGHKDWLTDNPANAAEDFARADPSFVIEEPAWKFNESTLQRNVTHWPSAWLKRIA
jgi:cephalosporin hydroxylase